MTIKMRCCRLALALMVAGCSGPALVNGVGVGPQARGHAIRYETVDIILPGAGPDGIALDYLVYDPRTKTVWVPAGGTGAVDVIDTATRHVSQLPGFAIRETERAGKQVVLGPSSVALGDPGTVYIGNRGDSTVCAIDEVKLTRGACATIDSPPDAIAYAAVTRELWVTTPRDRSIRVFDGATLTPKAKLPFDGEPEGTAIDSKRNRFYTNLEDQNVTVAIDLTTHQTVATWKSGCGQDGPRGLRLAEPEGFLLLACGTKIESLDAAGDGSIVSSVATGEGVDDFDYAANSHLLYAGAAQAAQLAIIALDAKGALGTVAVVPTREGARNAAVAADGSAYLTSARDGRIVVIAPVR